MYVPIPSSVEITPSPFQNVASSFQLYDTLCSFPVKPFLSTKSLQSWAESGSVCCISSLSWKPLYSTLRHLYGGSPTFQNVTSSFDSMDLPARSWDFTRGQMWSTSASYCSICSTRRRLKQTRHAEPPAAALHYSTCTADQRHFCHRVCLAVHSHFNSHCHHQCWITVPQKLWTVCRLLFGEVTTYHEGNIYPRSTTENDFLAMATNAHPSPQARIYFEDAFKRFEQTVQFDDKREFQLTTLKDVRDAARQIERDLGDRGCLRNMRRLQPFFDGLDRYSKIIEVLCNGTPYLPYIWVSQIRLKDLTSWTILTLCRHL